jgi:hypothetical protein
LEFGEENFVKKKYENVKGYGSVSGVPGFWLGVVLKALVEVK